MHYRGFVKFVSMESCLYVPHSYVRIKKSITLYRIVKFFFFFFFYQFIVAINAKYVGSITRINSS
jgi:hypothetical protein